MSIINNNKNKLPKLDAGLDGMKAFRALLKEKNIQTSNPAFKSMQTNKLFVEFTRSKINDGVKAKRNQIWYHADIKHYNHTGHLNTGIASYLINMVAEKQRGIEEIEAELSKDLATKMRAVLQLHKNS